jgi:hypothetical protein
MSKTKIVPVTEAELEEGVDQTEIALQIDDHLRTAAEDANQEPDGVRYAMFIHLARILAELGWTADELCDDVRYHVASQLSEGSA